MKIGDQYGDYICFGIAQDPPQWATIDNVEKVALEYLESIPGHWEYVYNEDDE
jgi:hypothetical protein